MYIPLYNADETKFLINVPFKSMYLFTGALPLLGFLSCLLLTMYKDYESANNTHCNVPNVFPSISAAIGNYSPQIYIWQTAIYLHAPGRFFTVFQRLNYYKSFIRDELVFLVYLSVALNFVENVSLLGLTFWTSIDYYPYHELCFKTFIACSLLSMALVCTLLSRSRRRRAVSEPERRSLMLKWRFFLINAVAFTCAAYFFLRHNKYCEPYIYSLFGFAEYIVVLSNIAYHYTTVHDFHRQSVIITKSGIFLK